MNLAKKISLILAALTVASSMASCAVPQITDTSITASAGAETYADFLADRLGDSMPESTVIAMGEDTEKYGVDLSEFVDDEGYTIRANAGRVVILGKSEAALDRAVRQYANYGNSDNYSYTYGEDYRVGSITIAGNHISEYVIMLPAENDACHTYAAENLRDYIGKACGTYPEIIDYSADAEGRFIRLERAYPEDEQYAVLGDEGFTISVDESGDMTILGGYYRGCMYGVFDFLEEHIGWRFLTDPSSYGNVSTNALDYLYESESVDIPADLEYTETADIAVRHNIFRGSVYGTEDFRAKRKINSNISKSKNSYGLIGFSNHGLQKAMKDSFFIDFDYDILKQPCFTDEELIETCKEYFTVQTQKKVDAGQVIGRDFINVDVAQFDTADFCLCETCAELYVLDGGNVGPVLYFTNEIARHLGSIFGDGIQISMFAYWGTSSVPKVTRPDDNVNVSFCFFTEVNRGECHNHCIDGLNCTSGDTVSNKLYGDQLRDWSEIAKTLTVWYYPGYWSSTGATVPFIKNLRDDIAFLKECGVDGIYVCVAGYYMANEKIIPYLLSNLVWDCDITEEEYADVVAEYYRIVYGEGYEYLLEYEKNVDRYAYDWCWSTNVFSNIRDRIDLKAVSDGLLCDIELFEKAKALAETAAQERYIEELSLSMYFTGLIASYGGWYENGTAEQKATYGQIHSRFMELGKEHGYIFATDFAYNYENFTKLADHAENLDVSVDIAEYFDLDMTRKY